jgi:membrane protein required for colicin V production
MNLIDSICLIILIYGSYKGFRNGIVGELLSFLGILLGIYLSKTYYPIVDEYLATIFDSTNQLVSLISVILIFSVTIILTKILSKVITKALNVMALGLLNKLIGSIFGLLKYLLILCIITFIFLEANDIFVFIETNKIEKTQIFSKIQKINDYILNQS